MIPGLQAIGQMTILIGVGFGDLTVLTRMIPGLSCRRLREERRAVADLRGARDVLSDELARARAEGEGAVGHVRWCSPRHRAHCEPVRIEFNASP